MRNLDYLEYEGSRLLDYAMKTYSKASTGSLVNDIERAVLAGHADGLSAPAKKRAVTSVMARFYFETKCPEAEASLLSRPGRGII